MLGNEVGVRILTSNTHITDDVLKHVQLKESSLALLLSSSSYVGVNLNVFITLKLKLLLENLSIYINH